MATLLKHSTLPERALSSNATSQGMADLDSCGPFTKLFESPARSPIAVLSNLRGIDDATQTADTHQSSRRMTKEGGTDMSELTRPESSTRRNPWRELEDLEKRLSTLFGRAPVATAGDKKEAIAVAEWSPLVDISEDDKEYLVKAELPEVKKEEIKINVHDDVLTISGERKYEKEEKGKKYHRVERAYGSFMRSFTLPEDADGSKISAEFKDGLLKVHLPKSEKAKPKAVEIKIA